MCAYCGRRARRRYKSMDFELPEELRLLKATLRRFVDNELIPIERKTTDGEQIKPNYLSRFETGRKSLASCKLTCRPRMAGAAMRFLAAALGWRNPPLPV